VALSQEGRSIPVNTDRVALRLARALLLVEGLGRWLLFVSIVVEYFVFDVGLELSFLFGAQALIVGIPALVIAVIGRLPRRGWPISLFLTLNTLSGIVDVYVAFTGRASPWIMFVLGLVTLAATVLLAFVAFPPYRLERPLMIAARLLLLGNGLFRWVVFYNMWLYLQIYAGLGGVLLFFVPALLGAPTIVIAFKPKLTLRSWQIWALIVVNTVSGLFVLALTAGNYLPSWMTASVGICTLGSSAALLVAALRLPTPVARFAAATSR